MIRLFEYVDKDLRISELKASEIAQIKPLADAKKTIWLDIYNESDDTTKTILGYFNCHELAIQDALRKRHPPKLETFDDYIFMLYRGISSVSSDLDIKNVQISFLFNQNYLISIHRDASLGIDHTMAQDELKNWVKTPLLLLSKILNVSAKKYLSEILTMEEELILLEDGMSELGNDQDLSRTIAYKVRLRRLKRTANYHERIMVQLLKLPSELLDFDDATHVLQDLFEKFERIHSLTAMFYDLCGDLIDGYLSITSHRLNKTMQILTVITAIFIPLGLLAGIYGMNFENIPELHHKHGYFILLSIMFSIAVSLFYIFKKKKWLE